MSSSSSSSSAYVTPCISSDVVLDVERMISELGRLSDGAVLSVTARCISGSFTRTYGKNQVIDMFSALSAPLGSSQIDISNPYVSLMTFDGPCSGFSIVNFEFSQLAVCEFLSSLLDIPEDCCDQSGSSSSSSSSETTTLRVLEIGSPTRIPKLVISVSEIPEIDDMSV